MTRRQDTDGAVSDSRATMSGLVARRPNVECRSLKASGVKAIGCRHLRQRGFPRRAAVSRGVFGGLCWNKYHSPFRKAWAERLRFVGSAAAERAVGSCAVGVGSEQALQGLSGASLDGLRDSLAFFAWLPSYECPRAGSCSTCLGSAGTNTTAAFGWRVVYGKLVATFLWGCRGRTHVCWVRVFVFVALLAGLAAAAAGTCVGLRVIWQTE